MGFPSIDGFWVSLDGVIEFRVDPKKAAEVYVTYNEIQNDKDGDSPKPTAKKGHPKHKKH